MSANDFKFLWSSPSNSLFEPKKKNHFLIQIGSPSDPLNDGNPTGFYIKSNREPDNDTKGVIWYAKSFNKPIISTVANDSEEKIYYQIGQNGPTVGVDSISYEAVQVTLIDPSYPSATRKLLRLLDKSRDISGTGFKHKFLPLEMKKLIGDIKIFQYSVNKEGNLVLTEEWTFYGNAIEKVDFGSMDYSTGDLVELSFSFLFSAFTVSMPKFGSDSAETFFSDGQEYKAKLINEVRPIKEQPQEAGPVKPPPAAPPASGGSTVISTGASGIGVGSNNEVVSVNGTTYVVSSGQDATEIQGRIDSADPGQQQDLINRLVSRKVITPQQQ